MMIYTVAFLFLVRVADVLEARLLARAGGQNAGATHPVHSHSH